MASFDECIGDGSCLYQDYEDGCICDTGCHCDEECESWKIMKYCGLDHRDCVCIKECICKEMVLALCITHKCVDDDNCGHKDKTIHQDDCPTLACTKWNHRSHHLRKCPCEINGPLDPEPNVIMSASGEYYTRGACKFMCEPIKCLHFTYCHQSAPQRYFDCHGGTCMICNMGTVPFEFDDDSSECPICHVIDSLIEVDCGHKFCYACWTKASESPKTARRCFLCNNLVC